ncbi:unnamed protein product [Ostreobium quekettii]|uniref:Uncharacterized protein n=1 Tax=Ostreobium quekettii TaxID=121088 RepID=A0A8S1IT17_9CHLO|nr:unnamed protein product [Ostreobium quekettii]|eukprot:evm.model.scf_74.5 EVM.evm.TU.scf_74.5   scf_74:28460-44976(-)
MVLGELRRAFHISDEKHEELMEFVMQGGNPDRCAQHIEFRVGDAGAVHRGIEWHMEGLDPLNNASHKEDWHVRTIEDCCLGTDMVMLDMWPHTGCSESDLQMGRDKGMLVC